MFLNKTIDSSLDSSTKLVLKNRKCPVSIYRIVWSYIPNNDKPPINKVEIYAKSRELESISLKNRGFIMNSRLRSREIDYLMYRLKSHSNIVRCVKSMYYDNDYRDKIRKARIFKIGPYVKVRKVLIENNII